MEHVVFVISIIIIVKDLVGEVISMNYIYQMNMIKIYFKGLMIQLKDFSLIFLVNLFEMININKFIILFFY